MVNNLPVGHRVGNYEIVQLIGAGGSGSVYRAVEQHTGRDLAVKVLGLAISNRDDRKRFHRQASAVAQLKSPRIPQQICTFQDSDYIYFVSELIDGCTLRQLINALTCSERQPGSIREVIEAAAGDYVAPEPYRFDLDSPDELLSLRGGYDHPPTPSATALQFIHSKFYLRLCCTLCIQLTEALAVAHDNGIIHRDVKPENLMLDRSGKPWVIDFGLARILDDSTMTDSRAFLGTPLYMSPEQLVSLKITGHRSDVYSLGLVLYELLSLHPPYVAESKEGLLRQIITESLIPLSRLNAGVSGSLEAVVHKATAKDPENRYDSMPAFAADLQRWLDTGRTSAPAYRYKYDRREISAERPKRISITFTCAMVVIVLCGLMIPTYFEVGGNGGVISRVRQGLAVSTTLFALLLLVSATGLVYARIWAAAVVGLICVLGMIFLGGMLCLTWLAGLGDRFVDSCLSVTVFFCTFGLFAITSAKSRSWFRRAAAVRGRERERLRRARPPLTGDLPVGRWGSEV